MIQNAVSFQAKLLGLQATEPSLFNFWGSALGEEVQPSGLLQKTLLAPDVRGFGEGLADPRGWLLGWMQSWDMPW